MPSIREQIEKGIVVCPLTNQRLEFDDSRSRLFTADKTHHYPVSDGVPILLIDRQSAEQYVAAAPAMVADYHERGAGRQTLFQSVRAWAKRGYPGAGYTNAFQRLFQNTNRDGIYLSVGGGPGRPHPCLVNLNIGLFPNVEIVADAHRLPYATGSVDGIYCDACLEHLVDPTTAVAEMLRVLKPGAWVLAATPFLQAYHGYPHHYQNFTVTGLQVLFERAGFCVTEAGACAGPVSTLTRLITVFIKEYFPRLIEKPIRRLWILFGALVSPLDQILNKRPNVHILAAATYCVAVKPSDEPAATSRHPTKGIST